ncbi:MAG: ATP-binding protein [Colwellia sp.]|nr:ATP-binding protein [Colwellia sp.]
MFRSLLEGHWLKQKKILIFSGARGCGKTYLDFAFRHYFCQQGISVRISACKACKKNYNKFMVTEVIQGS